MPLPALALVLCAALLHAFWNLVIARARDTQAATAVALAIGVVAALPLAILRWEVRAEAWPYIAASSALELLYFWLLTTAYRRAEMSLVYPIARGMAPVIVLIASVVVLGAGTAPAQALGVTLVGVGVVLVRGLRGGARWSDVALALAVATSIAGYTLVDQQGVRLADPVTYLVLILVAPAVISVAAVAARGPRGRVRRVISPLTVMGGLASVGAYALVLVALTLAQAPSVAAVREVSVVIGTGLAVVVLHERVTRTRAAGSIVVVAGVALVVAG
jgi:drug/metabolite transporter (DMT)-like permease